MKISTSKQHRVVHGATVDEDVVHRIIAECVAEKLGISLDGEGVSLLIAIAFNTCGFSGPPSTGLWQYVKNCAERAYRLS